jgi:hypothetical protein
VSNFFFYFYSWIWRITVEWALHVLRIACICPKLAAKTSKTSICSECQTTEKLHLVCHRKVNFLLTGRWFFEVLLDHSVSVISLLVRQCSAPFPFRECRFLNISLDSFCFFKLFFVTLRKGSRLLGREPDAAFSSTLSFCLPPPKTES